MIKDNYKHTAMDMEGFLLRGKEGGRYISVHQCVLDVRRIIFWSYYLLTFQRLCYTRPRAFDDAGL